MNSFRPFDPDRPLFSSRCSCGRHASDAEHALDLSAKIDEEQMSAIDFSMDIQREPDPKGDRVQVVLSGKYLSYKTY